MTVAERHRRQLEEALIRAQATLVAAGIEVRAEPSELGLARLIVAGEHASLAMSKDLVALATRLLAQRLATARPGRTVEVRVPPPRDGGPHLGVSSRLWRTDQRRARRSVRRVPVRLNGSELTQQVLQLP